MKLDVSVNKLFHEEATVIVWRNVKMLGIIPTGHFGHAAIMLRGASLGLGHDEYKYISWWPGDGAGKGDALRLQEGIAETNYHRDMKDEISPAARDRLKRGEITPRPQQLQSKAGWGTASDAQISVPGIGAPTDPKITFGLSLQRMWDWFEGYKQNNGVYKLASKTESCAGVAVVAMAEGGASAFASPPTMLIMAEPKQVEAYARTVQKKILEFNQRVVQFSAQAQRDLQAITRIKLSDTGGGPKGGSGVTGIQQAADLWTVTEWKRQSAVGGTVRSSTIRAIDSDLEKYHRSNGI